VPPAALEAAAAEATDIWAGAGLRLTWRSQPAADETSASGLVFVVILPRLTKPLGVTAAHSRQRAPLTLGQVPFDDDGRPANLIELSIETIAAVVSAGSYLDRPVATLPAGLQHMLLGRGLGRVIAHEIGHWLDGRDHALNGLMKRSFDSRDLVQANAPNAPRVTNGWTEPPAACR
jgi:hypothetical protein